MNQAVQWVPSFLSFVASSRTAETYNQFQDLRNVELTHAQDDGGDGDGSCKWSYNMAL